MKLILENWRSFLTEELLAEGILQDTKKKYPEMAEMGYIDKLSAEDPTGRNKYLRWMGQELQRFIEQDASVAAHNSYIGTIGKTLKRFEQQKARLRDKDINSYTLRSLLDALEVIGQSATQKRKEKKVQATKDSTMIMQDEDITVIRPLSEEASCYYGAHQTKWCISATKSQNYFDKYTSEGQAFYFVFNHHLKDDPEDRMLAYVVGSSGGEIEEIYNAEDDTVPYDSAIEIIMRNNIFEGDKELFDEYFELEQKEKTEPSEKMKKVLDDHGTTVEEIYILENNATDIYNDMQAQMVDDAQSNPAGPTDEQFKALEEEYNFEHMDVSFYDYTYDVGRAYYEFNAFTDFDFSKLDWVADPDDLGDEIREALKKAAEDNNVYPTEDDDMGYGYSPDIDAVPLRLKAEAISAPFEEYDRFLSEVSSADDEYDDIRRDTIAAFVEEGWIKGGTYHQLSALSQNTKLENFKIDFEKGRLVFALPVKVSVPGIQKLSTQYEGGDEYFKMNQMSEAIRKALRKDGELYKQFRETLQRILDKAAASVNQQLTLPGIEPEKVQKVSPDSYDLSGFSMAIGRENLFGHIEFEYDMNDGINKVKNEIRFIKQLDKMAPELIQILVKMVYSYAEKVVAERKKDLEDTTAQLMSVTENKIKVRLVKR